MFLPDDPGRAGSKRLLRGKDILAGDIVQMTDHKQEEDIFDKSFADQRLLEVHGAVEMVAGQLFCKPGIQVIPVGGLAVVPCMNNMGRIKLLRFELCD